MEFSQPANNQERNKEYGGPRGRLNLVREAVQQVKRKQQNELAMEQLQAIHEVAGSWDPLKLKIGTQDVFATFAVSDSQLERIVAILKEQ